MVYECEQCQSALPPGVTACPKCGDQFDDEVPEDAEIPSSQVLAPSPQPVQSQVAPRQRARGTQKAKIAFTSAIAAILALILVFAFTLSAKKKQAQRVAAAVNAQRNANQFLQLRQVSEATQRRAGQQNQQRRQEEAAAEATYRTQMAHNASQLSECLTTFSSLCQQPKFFDDSWKIRMAVSLVEIKQVAQQGQALSSPVRFQAVQSRYSAALNEYESIADEMPAAIDNRDAAKMQECITRMNRASELLVSSRAEMDRVATR